MNKTYKITIEVISTTGKEVPDWGLGPGILAEQKVVIKNKYLKNPFLHQRLYSIGQDIIEDIIKINITENE